MERKRANIGPSLTIISGNKDRTMAKRVANDAAAIASKVNYVSPKSLGKCDWRFPVLSVDAWECKNTIYEHVLVDLDETDMRFAAFMGGFLSGGGYDVSFISKGKVCEGPSCTKEQFCFAQSCSGEGFRLDLVDNEGYVLAGVMAMSGNYTDNLVVGVRNNGSYIDKFIVAKLLAHRSIDCSPKVVTIEAERSPECMFVFFGS